MATNSGTQRTVFDPISTEPTGAAKLVHYSVSHYYTVLVTADSIGPQILTLAISIHFELQSNIQTRCENGRERICRHSGRE